MGASKQQAASAQAQMQGILDWCKRDDVQQTLVDMLAKPWDECE